MSRPKPQRILSAPAGDGIHTVEIVSIPEQWAVTYRGELVSVVRQHLVNRPKYLRTMFQTAAPAFNLADKLNHLFDTEDFSAAPVAVLGSQQSGDREMPQPKRNTGGKYYVNIDSSQNKQAEVLENGHIVYRREDGTEQIRLNSRAFPTTNILKTIKKSQ